ncbi:unnamed protein product, partial [Prorocentrum cordatum]
EPPAKRARFVGKRSPRAADEAVYAQCLAAGNTCVPWSFLALSQHLAHSQKFLDFAFSSGPHSYADAADAAREFHSLDVVDHVDLQSLEPGRYILHTRGDPGHGDPLVISSDEPPVVLLRGADGAPEPCVVDLAAQRCDVAWAFRGPATDGRDVRWDERLREMAGADDEGEAREYLDLLKGGGVPGTLACQKCAFRAFAERRYLRHRAETYHTKERSCTACNADLQLKIARAIFQSAQSVFNQPEASPHSLLSTSAALVRDWVAPSEEMLAVLKKSNELPLVTVWTEDGAVMKLKNQPGSTMRLSSKVYYAAGFQAGVESICELVEHIFTSPESAVVAMKKKVMDAAVANGEFKCISHDATFKAAFAITGQTPMSQKAGGVHALRAFVAQSGLCPGRGGQRSEGEEDFSWALAELMPDGAIPQVEYLLSDSPSEYFLRHLPNCRGAAEDRVHLTMSIDGCTNERRTALSWRVLKLREKFQHPAPPEWWIYHGEPMGTPERGNVRPGRAFTDAQWEAYLEKPVTGVRECVGPPRRIAAMYPRAWTREDLRGVAVLRHHQRAGSHFYCAQNASVFRLLCPDVLKNAMRGEAIHRQVEDLGRRACQCRRERILLAGKIFGVYKALARSCQPCAVSLREGWRIALVAGALSKGAAPEFQGGGPVAIRGRDQLRALVIAAPSEAVVEHCANRRASRKERTEDQRASQESRNAA